MGYPDCDREVRETAERLWGNSDGQSVTEHRFGKGRVIWGRPLAAVLAEYGAPDFSYVASSADAEIIYIHRRTADAEIYFVANSQNRHESAICRFRASGKAPEILDPVTGTITRPALFRAVDGVTKLPMTFGPSGSAFVIFRKPRRHWWMSRAMASHTGARATGRCRKSPQTAPSCVCATAAATPSRRPPGPRWRSNPSRCRIPS
ncbi:MAG: hypothetical protein EHM17_03140 [Verrucomicrobiaceae bacterium]|nr:MAG: hypothetical protein EHM17_03140 [Verrucomicrobiaceae bacterium]